MFKFLRKYDEWILAIGGSAADHLPGPRPFKGSRIRAQTGYLGDRRRPTGEAR